jgi:hypothetical protein
MPVGETLTLLATLANALQTLRLSRPPAEGAASVPDAAAAELMALDSLRVSEARLQQEYDSALRRFDGLAAFSAIALLATAFAGGRNGAEAGSSLLVAAVSAFGLLVLCCVLTRQTLRIQDGSLAEHQLESVPQLIDRAREREANNRDRLRWMSRASDAILVIAAVQVGLGVVWVLA